MGTPLEAWQREARRHAGVCKSYEKELAALRAHIAAVTAERDRLREACERAKEHIFWGSPTNDTGATLDHLRAALAAPADDTTNTGCEPGGVSGDGA